MTIRHGVRKKTRGRKPKRAVDKIYWRGLENSEIRKLFEITAEQLITEVRETKAEKGDTISVKDLNDCINKAGKQTIPTEKRARNSWFKDDTDIIIPAVDKRNDKYEIWSNNPNDQNRANFTRARNELNKVKRSAIAKWMKKIAKECDDSAIKCNPKRAWEVIREIQQGLQGHHREHSTMKMRLENGELGTNDEENADVFEPHSFNVFNRKDAPVDNS
eukprot:scaffold101298_cov57-Attheya_sp.AAC.1